MLLPLQSLNTIYYLLQIGYYRVRFLHDLHGLEINLYDISQILPLWYFSLC